MQVRKTSYMWKGLYSYTATCSCKNNKYLESIIDNSGIMFDEIIDAEETKTVATYFNEKMQL